MRRSIFCVSSILKLALSLAAFSAALSALAGPVPTTKPGHYPAWWFERDVIARLPAFSTLTPTTTPPLRWPDHYPAADDYAVANLGQLKAIAAQASAEMDTVLSAPGAGPDIGALIAGWDARLFTNDARDDFAVLNQGQLKYVADLYYQRLSAAGATPLSPPWTPATVNDDDDDDYAAVNIGQLKQAFSFTPSTSAFSTPAILSAGANHVLVLRPDGTVWSWGNNDYGQLGLGHIGQVWFPTRIPTLDRIKSISAGVNHSLAARADGTVWAWGANNSGQLGTGDTTNSSLPVQVRTNTGSPATYLTSVTAVAAGENHSLARRDTGTVVAWGLNSSGQLGNNATGSSSLPVSINTTNIAANLTVSQIAAGYSSSYAILSDATVRSWGLNSSGQLGRSNTNNSSIPIKPTASVSPIILNNNAAQISAGRAHVLVRRTDGRVVAWGASNVGQLGRGGNSTAYASAPVLLSSPTSVVRVAAGRDHSLAYTANTTFSWGENADNKLGRTVSGTTNFGPVAISGLTTPAHIAAGGDFSLYADTAGTLQGFGSNTVGRLGDGTNVTPATVGARVTVAEISLLPRLSLPILSADGGSYLTAPTIQVRSTDLGVTLRYTWDGSEPNNTTSPIISSGGTLAAQHGRLRVKAFKSGVASSPTKSAAYLLGEKVAACNYYSLALRADGTLWSWGQNDNGQLGRGFTSTEEAPAPVLGLSGVIGMAIATTHSLAVKNDGTVWSWGSGPSGQLGYTASYSATPTQVSGLSGVIQVAASPNHSIALKADGSVWVWGHNLYGIFGDGSPANYTIRTTPGRVPNLGRIVSIAANGYTCLAIAADGSVWGWGHGTYGYAFGMEGYAVSLVPIQLGTVRDVVGLSASDTHALYLRGNGTVSTTGFDTYGALGEGSTLLNRPTPVTIPTLSDVLGLTTNANVSAAVTKNGALYTWGFNSAGQLGLGDTVNRFTPSLVAPLGLAYPTYHKSVALGGTHGLSSFNYAGVNFLSSWGDNIYNQLGAGTSRSVPAVILPGDADGDGLKDDLELALGSNPLNADSNGDGLSDNIAYAIGISLTSLDTDNDGVSNSQELALGLNVLVPDTDGDGVNDNVDAYPLDPFASSPPAPQPGDTTPPVITLSTPVGATLIP